MLRLRVVQAEFGDCLILEFGTSAAPRYVLIDGGPDTIYARHLRPELGAIRAGGGTLDLAILSHVDNDHAIGLLDFLAELRQQRDNGAPETIAVQALWHNAFSRTIGSGTAIQGRLAALLAGAGSVMTAAGMALRGIAEGAQLRAAAAALDLPVNAGFPGDLVLVGAATARTVIDNLTLRVVGPAQANLDELKAQWLEWLDTHEEGVASGDPFLMANADRSVPNLSSIMVLAEAHGKRILLTGDGRSDHLLDGLAQAGALDGQERLHVDVLKLPHHGSDRNITKKFFKKVTADRYVASANGKDGNPDLATLIWIVEAARDQGCRIEIVVTNRTPSTKKLQDEYAPAEYGYRLTVMKKAAHSIILDVAP